MPASGLWRREPDEQDNAKKETSNYNGSTNDRILTKQLRPAREEHELSETQPAAPPEGAAAAPGAARDTFSANAADSVPRLFCYSAVAPPLSLRETRSVPEHRLVPGIRGFGLRAPGLKSSCFAA